MSGLVIKLCQQAAGLWGVQLFTDLILPGSPALQLTLAIMSLTL